jgi:hypothetical protein
MIIPIKSLKGKEAGWINTKTRTYYSQRTPEHFMRMYQGFGISEEILSQLIDRVDEVCIIYLGKKRKYYYTCKLSQFLKSDKIYDNTEGKGIPDPQKFVSLKDLKEELAK